MDSIPNSFDPQTQKETTLSATLSTMKKSMSSLELVELINKVRKEENPNSAEVRHNDFLEKVRKVLGNQPAENFAGQ